MPEALNPVQQQVMFQAMGITPEQQRKLISAQQQEAIAQAVLQQGISPIDTNNRSIGGIGYKISPWEGIAKLADVISGKYQQSNANEALANALQPQQQSPPSGTTGDNISGQPMPQAPAQSGGQNFYDAQGNLTPIGYMQILNGNRAVAEMKPTNEVRNAQFAMGGGAQDAMAQEMQNKLGSGYMSANPGVASAQTAQGQNYAGTLPASMPPGGAGVPRAMPAPQAPQVNPVSGAPLPAPTPSAAPPMAPPTGGSLPLPPPPQSIPAPNAATDQVPYPDPSQMGANEYKAALEVATKANEARAEIAPAIAKAGGVAQANEQGKNIGESEKAVAAVLGRLPSAMGIIKNMQGLANQVPYGPMVETQRDIGNARQSPAALAYDQFNKLNENLFVQELPAIVQNSGGRIDIPLVKAIQGASAVPMDAQPASKQALLTQTQDLLGKVRDNALQNYRAQTGQDFDMSKAFNSPDAIKQAFQSGVLNKQQATQLLQQNHGMQ
jgi:hypothetical protein